ncbi:hypothetical protein GCM10010988_00420 [Cnuibacter physcomitrellae]|uniref:hypothetical protein n=1 Tax=Cnuibacter physcomitrellae TaxID=1619308 RepID=UPI0012F5228B|nr:hypothetical protein [Cnuibacter physcomitrellae]GGI34737.1 hypothetical protein GCM10010988_00420 [Cnuibacter physcomitrellae]
MVMIVIGGLIVAALGVVGSLLSWRDDGYGAAAARADYDSRRPHPSDTGGGRR